MFFSDISSIKRIFIVGTLAYFLVVILLRSSGKRTLSKMNAYDFIVTIALGSILASLLTNPDLKLFDGLFAFFLLIFLQFIFSLAASRWKAFDRFVKSEPSLLYYKESYDRKKMKKERIPASLILQAVRSEGHSSLKDVHAIILETDGTISVISKGTHQDEESSLQNIKKLLKKTNKES